MESTFSSFIQAYEGGLYAIIVSVIRLRSADAAQAGLDEEQIGRALRPAVFTDSATCSICIAAHGPRGSVLLRCGHCYHRECIVPWLGRARTCPLCRARASSDDEEEE
jgi:hypothetical protein